MKRQNILKEIIDSICDSVISDCENSFDESTTYLSSSIEVIYKGEPIGIVRYSATQNVLEPSFLGDNDYPPHGYESEIIVDDCEIETITSQKGNELLNLKNKLNLILDKTSIQCL